MSERPSERSLESSGLALASLITMLLETLRATNAIAHTVEFGGLSFLGLALPGPLIAVGGPMAATFGLVGIALSWKGRRAGHVIVLAFAAAFFVTHVLDQFHLPGPAVAEIAGISGLMTAWVTMLWAWMSLVVVVLAAHTLTKAVSMRELNR
jgi:hypothetical protein